MYTLVPLSCVSRTIGQFTLHVRKSVVVWTDEASTPPVCTVSTIEYDGVPIHSDDSDLSELFDAFHTPEHIRMYVLSFRAWDDSIAKDKWCYHY